MIKWSSLFCYLLTKRVTLQYLSPVSPVAVVTCSLLMPSTGQCHQDGVQCFKECYDACTNEQSHRSTDVTCNTVDFGRSVLLQSLHYILYYSILSLICRDGLLMSIYINIIIQ